jgi:hypothetical protein
MTSVSCLTPRAGASLVLALVFAAAGCATPPPPVPRAETVFAATADGRLVSFNAGVPANLLSDVPLTGIAAGERLLGIDFRVSRGQLFALGSSGRLYRVNPATGAAAPVGEPFAVKLAGSAFGFDFNPTVDRIRVVSDSGLNLRLHPDTGAVVDGDAAAAGIQPDAALAYAAGDVNAGRAPAIAAAAYTYNKQDEKVTTNFAIDARQGVLVVQGSREGVLPAVSPNTGQLRTVGPLGADLGSDIAFDIADVSNAAFAAGTRDGRSTLYLIDTRTGKAHALGAIGTRAPVVGIAVEP